MSAAFCRHLALLGLAVLAGCDGPPPEKMELSLISRSTVFDRFALRGEVLAEILTPPFEGVDPQALAGTLHLPPSYGEGRILTAVAADDRPVDAARIRIVIVNNMRVPMTPERICAAEPPVQAHAPMDPKGFTADMAVCRGADVLGSGSLSASSESRPRDPAFAREALERLLTGVVGSPAEREALDLTRDI